ncbi:unnamed protein product, partial [marine sediment metagenome]
DLDGILTIHAEGPTMFFFRLGFIEYFRLACVSPARLTALVKGQ